MSAPTEDMFCSGSDYKDVAVFDPMAYLQRLYFKPDGGTTKFDETHREINKLWLETFTTGGVKGQRLLDFGSGPSIHIAIPASYSFKELYLSDYAPQNRQALQDWVDRKLPHDWTLFFKMSAEHENSGITWKEVENRVRSKVKKIIPCDVNGEKVLELDEVTTFDCITASLCLGTCKDHETYQNVLRKFASFLSPNGFLIIVGLYGQTYYELCGKIFKTLTLNEELVRMFLKEAGFEIVVLRQFLYKWPDPATGDFEGIFFVRAQKKQRD